MNEFESLGFFDFEDFVTEMTDEQLIAVNGGSCGAGSSSISNINYRPTFGNCGGGGAVTPSNPVPVPSTSCGGGYNSSNQGSFSRISDLNLRKKNMQEYKDRYLLDASMNGEENFFSQVGCKMMAFAKILSQAVGSFVSMLQINMKYDNCLDGNIGIDELETGFKDKIKNKKITVDWWETKLTKEKLNEITKYAGDTYILGKAKDVVGKDHWIVLEGYSTNSYGQIEFSYNATSKNDEGRKYILGEPTLTQKQNKYFQITRIETVNIQ